jgi:unsaturated rhamnogalacturonyl hydrolase
MKRFLSILVFILMCTASFSQKTPASTPGRYAKKMAATVMDIWKDSFALEGKPAKWTYDMGVILKGFEGIWLNTGEVGYYNYIQRQMDFFVQEDGSIKTYKKEEFNIDNINNGKILLLLYRVTLKEKYLKAAKLLREQLNDHPRTKEGGFWHKKIYPKQMWLDGLYMAQPFYAEYAWLSHADSSFNDIANQFIWMERHARDPATGLLYHAYDESREMKWSDPVKGTSPHFWSRAMGWYATALVDALEFFPDTHPGKKAMKDILNRLVQAIANFQDPGTGLWYDVMNYNGPGKEKNYFEASASSQFVYAIAKGVRKGWLPAEKIKIANKGYTGIINRFIKGGETGAVHLHGTVKVSGLGGNPYRDGSFEYYMSEPVIVNDPKGIGAFLLASNEMELQRNQSAGRRKTVVMDNYFNRETKQDAFGNTVVFHYKWWEKDNGGFSLLGHVFNKYGVQTETLDEAPDQENLARASIYLLVDPDWPKENKNPNYISQSHIDALYNYVRNGGVLVMMANDSNNVEFKHYNELAKKFGIQWKENMRHDVIDNNFAQGALEIGAANPIFKTTKRVFIKQVCTQSLSKPAIAVYTDQNSDILMSVARVGKGTVFAVGDPWFYNEYMDGRKLPAEYENYKAAEELVQWLIKQASPPAQQAGSSQMKKIIVAADGSGDHITIQGAINSLPDSSVVPRWIYIKKGRYTEKLYIEKNNIVFEGEDRESTIITASIARDEWRCGHTDDWGVATMNIGANDITLKNLTITNSFGFEFSERTIFCPSDTSAHKLKTLRKDGHQMALRTMNATRLKAVNCRFRSYGGDTVSPWEVENGLWYFRNCIMEGGVDFYCPRGWAWAENCEFISHTGPAAIWHDGSRVQDSKTVLMNCKFSGYDGFLLGRYHRDAQFYLVNCFFSKNMRDSAIYRVATNNTIQWGDRVYYYNCRREGGKDFAWYRNNLPAGIQPDKINTEWVFRNLWHPEKE